MPINIRKVIARLQSLSIYHKIAIGNGLIMIFGAVAGTWLTRHLTYLAAGLWLVVLFASIGTVASLVINGWIIRNALRPVRELGVRLRTSDIHANISENVLYQADPDLNDLAQGLDRLITRLAEHNRTLRALSRRALYAQEEERKRISRSLHDDTGQALSTLMIKLDQITQACQDSDPGIQKRLNEAHHLASTALKDLRQIISGLRPTMLDDLGLVPAIRWYARSQLEEAGIRVDIDAPQNGFRLPAEIEINLYRIAQEAVNNILHHAGARAVSISLSHPANCIQLCIQDDGHGFDVEQASRQAISLRRWGLLGLQERVQLSNGQLDISSTPGQGTRITVSLPLEVEGKSVP